MVPRDQTQVISLDSSHFSSLSHFTSPLSFINHCFCDSAWLCHLLLGEVLTNTHSYFCPLLTRYNLHPFSPLTLQDIALTSVLFKNQHYPEFDGANDMFVPVLNVLLILAFLLEAWSKKQAISPQDITYYLHLPAWATITRPLWGLSLPGCILRPPRPQPYPLLSWADLDSISLHWWDLAPDLMRVFREPFWSRLFRVLDNSGRGGQTFERRTLQIDSFAIHGHETCNSEVIASCLPPFVPFPL